MEEDVMFYRSKNHKEGLKSVILVATVTANTNQIRLIRLHGKLSIKASEDLTLYTVSAGYLDFGILEKSIFTM